ncbi:MAG: hypothetical protein JWQ96_1446 [Segetibacter sp.]|nr:hypothetical protein [Segetibacter sp.]
MPRYLAEVPPVKGNSKSVANIQFEMMSQHPYKYTSDEIIFHCHATKKGLHANELKDEQELFFSKGQPCLRSSSLAKRYGWGIHSNEEGKVALYGIDSPDYRKFANDENLKIVKAMRSKKA